MSKFLYNALPNLKDCSKRFTPSQTCSIKHHLSLRGKHPAMLQLMREDNSYTYINLCLWPDTHFIQMSELEQLRLKTCPKFDMTAQHSNSDSLIRASDTLTTAPLWYYLSKQKVYLWKLTLAGSDLADSGLLLLLGVRLRHGEGEDANSSEENDELHSDGDLC